jgi:hypothetical protein
LLHQLVISGDIVRFALAQHRADGKPLGVAAVQAWAPSRGARVLRSPSQCRSAAPPCPRASSRRLRDKVTGGPYLEGGQPVVVLARWNCTPAAPWAGIPLVWHPRSDGKPHTQTGPHNVLIERADGSRMVARSVACGNPAPDARETGAGVPPTGPRRRQGASPWHETASAVRELPCVRQFTRPTARCAAPGGWMPPRCR